jgi:hypothetical protein
MIAWLQSLLGPLADSTTWAVAGALGFIGTIGLLVRSTRNWIKEKQKDDAHAEELKQANAKAQEFADMPMDAGDAARRLRNRAAKKRD